MKEEKIIQNGMIWLGVAIATSLIVIGIEFTAIKAQEAEFSLPPLQVHPLPPSLSQWQALQEVGDYFSQVKPVSVGYLIWSQLPIKVYLQRPKNPQEQSAETLRFQKWVAATLAAVQEWNAYLPLEEIEQPDLADIIIERSPPPLGTKINPETGQIELSRARSAQTRYEFYLRSNHPPILSHRMTIQIHPGLNESSILAATRHELGHALGIWGHSPLESDALYFSQVRNPPPISERDINTLKKVYQQPTRLGWKLKEDAGYQSQSLPQIPVSELLLDTSMVNITNVKY